MRKLKTVTPTPEQLKLITLPRPGIKVIRGAAGSGKTTTSIMMMKMSLGYLIDYYKSNAPGKKLKLVVFTFNRTLSAYVEDLVRDETYDQNDSVDIEITTLGNYLYNKTIIDKKIIGPNAFATKINEYGSDIHLDNNFLVDEVEYVIGRLDNEKLEDYINLERTGRGSKPRIDKSLRRVILDDVIYPYIDYKKQNNLIDWNDLAILYSKNKIDDIQIAVIDEAQDFSANQLRAILNQCANTSFVTIVLDSAQKIYKRGFSWKEIGVSNATYARLERNYRNTYQVANFAFNLLNTAKISIDEDGTLPILSEINRHGPKPYLIEGAFKQQMQWIISFIKGIDLTQHTIGFLHPKGGAWFNYLRQSLQQNGIAYEDITRMSRIESNSIAVSLSTIHSAKGLEFDYVFVVGIEEQHFIFSEEDNEDNNYSVSLKLLAMAITRAKENVIISYKENSKPNFLNLLSPDTYTLVRNGN